MGVNINVNIKFNVSQSVDQGKVQCQSQAKAEDTIGTSPYEAKAITKSICMQDEQYDHGREIAKVGRELKILSQSNMSHLDIKKSVSDLDDANRNPVNPLKPELPLESKSFLLISYSFH